MNERTIFSGHFPYVQFYRLYIYEERVHFGVYVVYESHKMSAFIITRTNWVDLF